ncbi:protein ROOT HAIR SPECIFIC 17-like [Gastrolobium bilobum]|uniref:protein ROOT HAIR SPECIFIC 17-like n=1 Tax=Gastrolobium bilobum TaxID=150636 RepID=UPI002AB14CDF|nr:protein ROOT HAIR SPECIFIC 17-like [Gastrolobium bilobum]
MSVSMKRKKHHAHTEKSRIIGLLVARFLRHRLLHRPLISAVSGSLLLLFAALSLFAPSPVERVNGPALNSNQDSAFRVPAIGGSCGRDLWSSMHSELFSGCSNASVNFAKANVKTHPDRYLLIATSGGLNQQRTGIIDAVVAAYLLNATLVVPELDHTSFWKDTSHFSELFDADWFITSLQNDVRIIKQLPDMGEKFVAPYTMRVPRKCTPKCYEDRVLPVMLKKRAVRLTKFDYRLSNMLDEDLQRLRCRVNYHALKFTDSIQVMGNLLVERMRLKSKHFIALHLRFEPDMLAFSGCYYGGGNKERIELGEIRKRWKSLHVSNPDKVRRHGRCPLTPEEVGIMLRALGFGSDVHLYVASGEIYGGEETLAPLKALFPNFHSKETLATKEELAPFVSFSSRMAALDYIVCDDSDVFVTNNNGNMAKILAGRRRYFGHKPTIRPNGKKLNRLFMNKNNMTWEEFASRVRTSQVGFMGEPNELKPGRGEFHENPTSCICQNSESEVKIEVLSNPQIQTRDSHEGDSKTENRTEEQFTEEEQEWSDVDYSNSRNQIQLKGTRTDSLPLQMGTDQAELQEFFSD